MNTDLITRSKDFKTIEELLKVFPVVAILGPRQVGKTTLAKLFKPDHIFDLENPRDLVALQNPQLVLENAEGLVMLDEIQRKSDLFPLLRYLVDQGRNQKFLILGSASSTLRKQCGESLAGRIGYHYMSGFSLGDVGKKNLKKLWVQGGFPKSFLADPDESLLWRNNFIGTYLERDLASIGTSISTATMYRFWTMISHYHGQTLNYSDLGRSLGLSDKTIKHYIDILEDTFMIRTLKPWYVNVSKRLIKTPKLYIRDSGIFHTLQGIDEYDDLVTNPKIGASWEGFAMELLISVLEKRENEVFFYGAHSGVEVDLFWHSKTRKLGIEFKYSDAPTMTRSMHQAILDLKLDHLWVIYPGDKSYPLDEKVSTMPLQDVSQDTFKL